MSQLLGQGGDFKAMLEQARRGTMHHGVVITGPRGTGKTTAAREIASVLLQDLERVATGAHPDLHLLQIPEDKEDIPVDMVRQLRENLLRRPVAGGARVVILDPADRLNEQGQNALLKTLEEPGSRTWLLLPTRRPEALLATVWSRVTELRMRPLPLDLLQAQLRTLAVGDEAGQAWAASLSRGSLGLAQQLLQADLQEVHRQVVEFLAQGQGAAQVASLALAGTQGRPQTLERARLVLCLCREILRNSLLRPTAG